MNVWIFIISVLMVGSLLVVINYENIHIYYTYGIIIKNAIVIDEKVYPPHMVRGVNPLSLNIDHPFIINEHDIKIVHNSADDSVTLYFVDTPIMDSKTCHILHKFFT